MRIATPGNRFPHCLFTKSAIFAIIKNIDINACIVADIPKAFERLPTSRSEAPISLISRNQSTDEAYDRDMSSVDFTQAKQLMKFLPPDLKKEYERLTLICPDLEQLSPPCVNVSDVLRAYFILADYFTDNSTSMAEDKMEFGLRGKGELLYSALSRQCVSFGRQQKYTEPLDICATLFFGLVKDHAFFDGNKRTALLVLLYQLQLFHYYPYSKITDFETLVMAVAASKLQKVYPSIFAEYKNDPDQEVRIISKKLKDITSKKDHTYHIAPTMREFCASLEDITGSEIQTSLENGKIKFARKVKRGLFGSETLTFSATFGGWSRIVGAKTAREILKKLELYDQFASYKDLLHGKEPMYALVDKFNAPLRRLKDK